jgi:hypothetical protein
VTERRGRGRRDNGLDALLWAPVRDVDPRVGEHLLDVLREAGIAAYLEPAADVAPYTRNVYLPSPPSDRLFVDRERRTEARGLVEQHGDEHGRRLSPLPRDVRRDLDEEAEWARIVAAFDSDAAVEPSPRVPGEPEAERGRTAVERRPADPPPSAPGRPPLPSFTPQPPAPEPQPQPQPLPQPEPPAPRPQSADPEPPELAEEHYDPPPPPPLRAPAPASLYAVLLVLVGALLVGAPSVLDLSADVGIVVGAALIIGGVVVLVSRMRDRSDEDGDDGAVV